MYSARIKAVIKPILTTRANLTPFDIKSLERNAEKILDRNLDSLNSKQTLDFYYFSEFRLDVDKRRLWHGEELVSLTPKEIEVLLFLIERAGKVVEKNDLLDAIWTDTFVEESTLARNVSWLRKKLSRITKDEKLIETVPKRGYRFIAKVTRSSNDENVLIVEEQTIQHFQIEETMTVDSDGSREKALPQMSDLALPTPKRKTQTPKLIWLTIGLVAITGISFIVYQNYFRTRAPISIVASNIKPFSGAVGNEDGPTFSPDNKQLAYSWNGGEGRDNDIYIRDVISGKPQRLTDSKLHDRYPTFSPDGSRIAFLRESKTFGELITIPSTGGKETRIRRLFSGNYSISYAPGGKTIAVINTDDSTDDGQYAIYLVDTESHEHKRLTEPGDFIGETTPRFSPDGKNLAFVRIYGNQKQDLFVVPANGGKPTQITFDGVVIHSLTWSADGKMIYFVSFRASNQARLWRIPAAGGEPEIVAIGGNNISNVAISPDGRKLAFVETKLKTAIWQVKANGQRARKFMTSNDRDLQPQYFPDGSHFLFKSHRTGTYHLWKSDASGKNLTQITFPPTRVDFPQLSSDGSLVAFHGRIGEEEGIYVISANGGKPQLITNEKSHFRYARTYNLMPAWSPDNKWIYFRSKRSGESQIWKKRSDGTGEAIQITKGGGFRASPLPDGKTIFYTKSADAKEMWRTPAKGGKEELVPEFAKAGFEQGLHWTMTKESIYFFVRETDKGFNIKLYDFATQQIEQIDGNYNIPANLNLRDGMTTNGKIFLFTVQDPLVSYIMLADLPQ